jgi:hypothetical protein
VVIRPRGEGEEEEEEKEGEVEKTGYRLHLMSMGEGVLTAFKYPVCWFYQDEIKWLCSRGPKNSGRMSVRARRESAHLSLNLAHSHSLCLTRSTCWSGGSGRAKGARL